MHGIASDMSTPSHGQEHRARQLRRAFQRLLRRRPTMLERIAMTRCALLVARAEAAAADPNATHDDVVRLDGAAVRAQRRMVELLGVQRKSPVPSLAEILAKHDEAAE
jgi:hypothetical protein